MKAKMKVVKEVDVKYLGIYIPNIDEYEENVFKDFPISPIPLTSDIEFLIDIDEGRIVNYNNSKTIKLLVHIRDSGSYYLLDKDLNHIAEIEEDYVPNKLIPGNYGDIIDLQINNDGIITNWYDSPNFNNFEEFNIEE